MLAALLRAHLTGFALTELEGHSYLGHFGGTGRAVHLRLELVERGFAKA